ncbi:MAG TPA: carbon-nitrogen hydrolase family protein [Burkholderiales bacterium]|jgi:nitrilase|nr:carbon-nitrogen hydrolase family protein [Burkholderiales bacterium]
MSPATPRSGFGRAKPRGSRESGAGKSQAQGQGFRIAGVQMASGPNVPANLNEAGRLIEMAAAQGAKLVALPEYFAIMGMRPTDKVKVREKEGEGPIQDFLAETARRLKIWLVGCSVPIAAPTEGKVFNSCMAFDDAGRLAARYDKVHLFSLDLGKEKFAEEGTLEAGKHVKVVDSPFGRIGLSVCYDLRFPELYRAMKDVDIIVVPSAFTETTGRAHWEALVRARAIENLAYVLAPAQGGYHLSGRETHGDSMIVDPWGTVLDRLPRGSGIVSAWVNPAYQASVRKSLPALAHRAIHRV